MNRSVTEAFAMTLAAMVLAVCGGAPATSRPSQAAAQSSPTGASTGATAVVLSATDVPKGFTAITFPVAQIPTDPGVTQAIITYVGGSSQSITTGAFVFPNIAGAQAHLAYLVQTQPNGLPESPSPGFGQESHLYAAADQVDVLVLWRDRTVVNMIVTSAFTTGQALQFAARQEARARATLGG